MYAMVINHDGDLIATVVVLTSNVYITTFDVLKGFALFHHFSHKPYM